jgi:5-methylcytosine-specific restriction endonuclease McrA
MQSLSMKRRRIYRRDGYRCHYCRIEVVVDVPHDHPRRATFDHKQPRSKVGSNDADNIVTCCNRCNLEKSDIPYEMYRWFRHMLLKGHTRQELLNVIADACESQTEDA